VTKHTINIQDGFLFQSLKLSQVVICDLVNGRSLEGRIKRFDRFAVVLDRSGEEILIYKHAIATIAPAPAHA
jgi:host factor-I protein